MRVLEVVHAFAPEGLGGTERYVEAIARTLVERGHEVKVLCGSLEWRPKLEVDRFDHGNVPVVRVHRNDLYFDHWDKLFQPHVSEVFEDELVRWRPELVHVHHWIRLSSDLVRRAAQAGAATVVHLHDHWSTCPRVFRVKREESVCDERMGESPCTPCVPRWKFQGDEEIRASLRFYESETRAELAAADVLLSPSASHAQSIEGFWPEAKGRVHVLAHPELSGAAPIRGTSAASPAGRLKLLFFSHLYAVKGLHRLMEALQLLRRPSGVELDVFGAFTNEEYETRVRRLAEGLSVRFHGAFQPGEPAQCPSDVVVLPFLARESYSFLLDEALALGVPILASRSGALAERAGGRALLFDANQPAELAACIERLRDDLKLRQALASSSPSAPTSLPEHVTKLQAHYSEALEVCRGRSGSRLDLVPLGPLKFEWDRREAGFRELLRSEGWEQALADLHGKLDALQRERGPSA